MQEQVDQFHQFYSSLMIVTFKELCREESLKDWTHRLNRCTEELSVLSLEITMYNFMAVNKTENEFQKYSGISPRRTHHNVDTL